MAENDTPRLDWQERLVLEGAELAGRVHRLNAFINGYTFIALPLNDRMLLREQLRAMKHYLVVLNSRIANFQ